ncbi:hypothetical protein, partial [Brasilonema octagenarum]
SARPEGERVASPQEIPEGRWGSPRCSDCEPEGRLVLLSLHLNLKGISLGWTPGKVIIRIIIYTIVKNTAKKTDKNNQNLLNLKYFHL